MSTVPPTALPAHLCVNKKGNPILLDIISATGGVVTPPALTLANTLPVGFPSTLGMTAMPGLNGAHVAHFWVRMGEGELEAVPALDNAAQFSFTPTGKQGDTLTLFVVAEDNYGNRSQPTCIQCTLMVPYIAVPTLISPASGAWVEPGAIPMTCSPMRSVGITDTHVASQWKICTDEAGGNILYDSGMLSAEKLSHTAKLIPPAPPGGTLYLFTRPQGEKLGLGPWCAPVRVCTPAVNKPAFLSPLEGQTGVALRPEFKLTPFSNLGPEDTYKSTYIDIYDDPDLKNRIAGYSGPGITVWTPEENLPLDGDVYATAHVVGSKWGDSALSEVRHFKTLNAYVEAPTITAPANGATGVALQPTITLSAFSNVGPADTGKSTYIRVYSDEAKTVKVAEYSGPYTTSWTVPTALALDSPFWAEAEHEGNTWGKSATGATVGFRTLAYSVPLGTTWLIRESGAWTPPVPGGVYEVWAIGGGGGGAAYEASATGYRPYIAGGGGGSGYGAHVNSAIRENITITIGNGGAAGDAAGIASEKGGYPGGATTVPNLNISALGGAGAIFYGSSFSIQGGHGGNGGGGGCSFNTLSATIDGSPGQASGGGGHGYNADSPGAWGTDVGGTGGNGAGPVVGLPSGVGGTGGTQYRSQDQIFINGGKGGTGYGAGGGGAASAKDKFASPTLTGGAGGGGLVIEGKYLGGAGGNGGNVDTYEGLITTPGTAGESGGVLIKLTAYPS